MQKYKLKEIRRKIVLVILFPILWFFIYLFRILPIAWVRKFAHFGGRMFYKFAHKSRETAQRNLRTIYPNKFTPTTETVFLQRTFSEIIKSFFDYMAYSMLKNRKKYFQLVSVEGEEHLKKAYDRGKGVICLMPHMSSWELAAITPPMMGYPTWAASKAMKSPLLENTMNLFRGRRGLKNITRENSYQALVEVLQKGNCLILMTDQDTKVKGVFADFLGKSAYTPIGAVRLQADTDCAVVPMCIHRKEDGNYKFTIFPAVERLPDEDTKVSFLKNTQQQNIAYDKMIALAPNQWVWMHERWKTTPESLNEYLQQRGKKPI